MFQYFYISMWLFGLFLRPLHASVRPSIHPPGHTGLTSSSTFTVFLQLCMRVVKLDVVGEL